jgi:predicted RNA methylase
MMYRYFMMLFSKKNDVVVDLFTGTAAAACAAAMCGRSIYAVDSDTAVLDAAKSRLKKIVRY